MRKLGEIQIYMLRSLSEHKRWYQGCGWIWDSISGTERLLESLRKRGLVDKIESPPGRGARQEKWDWVLTAFGLRTVADLRKAGKIR